MEFSFIIPAHKAQKDLFCTALSSVLKQKISDFECLILCDDGSVDPAWITDSRIKLFPVSPSSFGAKHNEGIRRAQGDYIVFLDADDALSKEYLTESHLLISKYHPSIIFFDWSSDPSLLSKDVTKESAFYDNDEIKRTIVEHYFSMNSFPSAAHWSFGSMWAKVFSRKALLKHQIFEPEEYIGSGDQIFVYEAAINCDDGAVVSSPFVSYFWRINSQSVSNQKQRGSGLAWYPDFVTQLFEMLVRNKLPQSVLLNAEEYASKTLIEARLSTPLSVVPPLKIKEIHHLLLQAVPPKSKVHDCFQKRFPPFKSKGRQFLMWSLKHKQYWLASIGIAFYHRKKTSI